jgi:hypothetical protein
VLPVFVTVSRPSDRNIKYLISLPSDSIAAYVVATMALFTNVVIAIIIIVIMIIELSYIKIDRIVATVTFYTVILSKGLNKIDWSVN